MANAKKISALIILLFACAVFAKTNQRNAQIGYIFPAGGKIGTSFTVTIGGQYLKNPAKVIISGNGVKASIVTYAKPLFSLDKEQRKELRAAYKTAIEYRSKEKKGTKQKPLSLKFSEHMTEILKHPLLWELEKKSLVELIHVQHVINSPNSRVQKNRQLAESVILKLEISPNAKPGTRELRIQTKMGLTNPIVFEIGNHTEFRELEPNSAAVPQKILGKIKPPIQNPLSTPITINGQILPGDIDRFSFEATKGQTLIINAKARSLIPFLADAVPGWFQSTLTLFDSSGKKIAFADDYRFDPDPVIIFNVEKTGVYDLEITDSIYRGREDFVYRISIDESPFITDIFPLGAKMNSAAQVKLNGYNLIEKESALNTKNAPSSIRHSHLETNKTYSNQFSYAINSISEIVENESNNDLATAQDIALPVIINGQIKTAQDKDFFSFNAKTGEEIAVQVVARQLNSPLDSLVRIIDAQGKMLAYNDDYIEKDKYLHKDSSGLITHHADSYLRFTIPADGKYFVNICDSQTNGSVAHSYRLRISKPMPDFELRVTPSSIVANASANIPITVYILRKDGFDGKIKLSLKNSPTGFKLSNNLIPANCDKFHTTLSSAKKLPKKPISLTFQGCSRIDGKLVERVALAADDCMQAFLYRHLVPAQEFVVGINKTRWQLPKIELETKSPVEFNSDNVAHVNIDFDTNKHFRDIKLKLESQIEGISLGNISHNKDRLSFEIVAEKSKILEGFEENLIIEILKEITPKNKDGKKQAKTRLVSIGYLPAIPVSYKLPFKED